MAASKKIDYPPTLIEFLFNQVLEGRESKFRRYHYFIRYNYLRQIIDFYPLQEAKNGRGFGIITNISNISDYFDFEHNSKFFFEQRESFVIDSFFNHADADDFDEWGDNDEEDSLNVAKKIDKLYNGEKIILVVTYIGENRYKLTPIDLNVYYDLLDKVEEEGNKVYLEDKYNEFGQRKYAAAWEWRLFFDEFLPMNNIEFTGWNDWDMQSLLNGTYKRDSDANMIYFYKFKMRGPNLILSEKPETFIELWDILYNSIFSNEIHLKRTYLAIDYPKHLCYDGWVGNYFDSLFKGNTTHKPFIVKSRALLSYTFNRLKDIGYIADNWQNVAEKNFLFVNEAGKLLTANSLSQSKYNISYSKKNKPKGAEIIDEIIDRWCK